MKKLFTLIMIFVNIGSFGCSNLISSILEETITKPVIERVEIVREVTQKITSLSVKQLDEDVKVSWDNNGAKKYKVFRAWSYPQHERSYQLIGETTQTSFIVEGAYWSGIHYYAIKPVYDNRDGDLSSYVLYSPKS